MKRRDILLVNPWIHDFAAYDMWARPLGLLCLAGVLRQAGFEPWLIDCTDRHHSSVAARFSADQQFGCGKYPSEEIAKPAAIGWINRIFRRYGITPEAFAAHLARLPEPAAILVTSRMTYWYPGVQEAIGLLKRRWPKTPLALGGVWPTLYPEHAARHSGADAVFSGEGENQTMEFLETVVPECAPLPRFELQELDSLPEPAYDLLSSKAMLPVLTSRGCPRRCTYCASHRLYSGYRRRQPHAAARSIIAAAERFGTHDFAFYDDALLCEADAFIKPLLREVEAAGGALRFHAPNGLHSESIDEELALLLSRVGFQSLRLSLETASDQRRRSLRREGDTNSFAQAVAHLRKAGFSRKQLGVYLMCGLPEQDEEEVREGLELIIETGAWPRLVEYSPLPGTLEYERARAASRLPIEDEPLLCNNSVFHLISDSLPKGAVQQLRQDLRCRLAKLDG
jgi:sulfatase maturation enzyme AslB (radical SAM superfamily)